MIDALALIEDLTRRATEEPEAMAALSALGAHVDPFNLGLHDAMLSGWYNDTAGELMASFPVGPDDVVLDVGCGDGGAMNFCARRGAQIILADLDAERIARAAEWIANNTGQHAEFHVTDANPLPLADSIASRVVCMEVLEHVDDPAVTLAELVRVGRPGALYLLTAPDPVAEKLQRHLAPEHYFRKPNHVRIFERTEFEILVSGAGLTVEHRYYYGFYWAVWWLLFWQCDVPFSRDLRHPILDNWARTWSAVLAGRDGLKTKRLMDRFMPKSQVIVARKPPQAG
jgi:SAM-dependent methyltransferase